MDICFYQSFEILWQLFKQSKIPCNAIILLFSCGPLPPPFPPATTNKNEGHYLWFINFTVTWNIYILCASLSLDDLCSQSPKSIPVCCSPVDKGILDNKQGIDWALVLLLFSDCPNWLMWWSNQTNEKYCFGVNVALYKRFTINLVSEKLESSDSLVMDKEHWMKYLFCWLRYECLLWIYVGIND